MCCSYQTLKRKGLSHQYECEGEPTRPILDHEIAAAIESLQTSTTAIEEQCRVLEVQRDALMRLKALDKPNLNVEHARNERRRKERLKEDIGRWDMHRGAQHWKIEFVWSVLAPVAF